MFKLYNNNIKTFLYRSLSGYPQVRRIIRAALLQLRVSTDPLENLNYAVANVKKATKNNARLVILPECPYSEKKFVKYAESVYDGNTSKTLSRAAKENSIYLVGGTFPEKLNDKVYNTCAVWNPLGELVAVFRKLHMFDVEITGGITYKESDGLSPGLNTATFMLDDIKVGLGICHDLRFEELAKLYRLQNCKMLIYPSAFSMTTGPIQFELLQRARAADNQMYVITVSPARSQKGYIAWGHSQVTNPWGQVTAKAGYKEEMIYCDLDLDLIDEVRQQIPIFNQRRSDIYDTTAK